MTTITDAQIRQLRAEALDHRDYLQATICDIALGTGLGDIVDIDEDFRAALEALGIIPEHVDADARARDLCATVIETVGLDG